MKRLYEESYLKALYDKGREGREELEQKLANEKTISVPEDRTEEERTENIRRLEFALNGGVKNTREDVLEDIKAGSADISDMGGNI